MKYEEFIKKELNALSSEHSIEYVAIVEKIISRVDFEEITDDDYIQDEIIQNLNDVIIYSDDMWTIARDYCFNPRELDMDDAYIELIEICEEIVFKAWGLYQEEA